MFRTLLPAMEELSLKGSALRPTSPYQPLNKELRQRGCKCPCLGLLHGLGKQHPAAVWKAQQAGFIHRAWARHSSLALFLSVSGEGGVS